MAARAASFLAFSAALFAASLPASASAQPNEYWRALSESDHCDLRFYRGEMMVLMIRDYRNGSYSLSGEAFRMPETDADVSGAIKVTAGDEDMLLNGSQNDMQAQAQRIRSHPISHFLALIDGEETLSLDTEAGLQQIPLTGLAPVAEEFADCRRGLRATGPRAPVLVSFDGIEQLGREASRQRLLSEKLGYTLSIDAEGNPTDCELSRKFRRRAVTIALCRPLLNHATFEPALDADGKAVAGTFFIDIDFDMWMTQRGYLEAEDR